MRVQVIVLKQETQIMLAADVPTENAVLLQMVRMAKRPVETWGRLQDQGLMTASVVFKLNQKSVFDAMHFDNKP